jgi:hypothetical protein
MEKTMTLIQDVRTQTVLISLEQLHIHILQANNELIPEQKPQEHNPTYETLFKVHLAPTYNRKGEQKGTGAQVVTALTVSPP